MRATCMCAFRAVGKHFLRGAADRWIIIISVLSMYARVCVGEIMSERPINPRVLSWCQDVSLTARRSGRWRNCGWPFFFLFVECGYWYNLYRSFIGVCDCGGSLCARDADGLLRKMSENAWAGSPWVWAYNWCCDGGWWKFTRLDWIGGSLAWTCWGMRVLKIIARLCVGELLSWGSQCAYRASRIMERFLGMVLI